MAAEYIDAEKAEMLLLAHRLRMRLAGMATVDPVAAADMRLQLAELIYDGGNTTKLEASKDLLSSNVIAMNVHETDIEGFILEILGEAERPMSVEQIYEAVQEATDVEIRRETLAVRLHRLAKPPHNKIVNTSRGHYWAREGDRMAVSR